MIGFNIIITLDKKKWPTATATRCSFGIFCPILDIFALGIIIIIHINNK